MKASLRIKRQNHVERKCLIVGAEGPGLLKLRLKGIAETEGNYHFMRKRIFFPAEQEIQ